MSDVHDTDRKAIATRVMARLSVFALGLGLYDGIARGIVEKVVAEMPSGSEEQITATVRLLMMYVSG